MAYGTMPEFVLPSFLQNQSAERIHQEMMDQLPADIDDTPAGYPWDFTKPASLQNAKLLQFYLPETIKMMFYMWATGSWLDHHATVVNLTRKPANPASGDLMVEGSPGLALPAGFAFATPAVDDTPSIIYRTTKEAVIDDTGSVTVQVVCEETGLIGNVAADTIILMLKPVRGITAITNPDMLTGGVEIEDDEALRVRIDEKYKHIDDTYIGNDWDYIRWATEVPGCGSAFVIPIPYGAGTVKVVCVDSNGYPANQMILDAVYDYIVAPNDRIRRKAPIEATVYVVAPTPKQITYTVSIVLLPAAVLENVLLAFKEALTQYYIEAVEDKVVRYNRVSALLTNTTGVKDFIGLLMNGSEENIHFAPDEYPVTQAIDATVVEAVSVGG